MKLYRITLLTCIFIAACALNGCAAAFNGLKKKEPISASNFQLDTMITLTIYDSDDQTVFQDVFNEIARLEALLSASAEGSDLRRLAENAGAGFIEVSEDTVFLLEESRKLSELSGGKFDCTIGPLNELWDIKNKNGHFPSEDELAQALALVNYKDVLIKDGNYVMLKKEGMSISFGAVAKGYIADKAAELLAEKGVGSALIDLGGNILLIGQKPEGGPFKIGVRNPSGENGEYLGVITANDKSIVSSGGYERYFVHDGKQYHHIFDLETGYPAENELLETTIIADCSTDGDGFSTTAFVLGLEKGLELVEGASGIEGVFVTNDNKVYLTSGIGNAFELTDKSYEVIKR